MYDSVRLPLVHSTLFSRGNIQAQRPPAQISFALPDMHLRDLYPSQQIYKILNNIRAVTYILFKGQENNMMKFPTERLDLFIQKLLEFSHVYLQNHTWENESAPASRI